LAKQVANIPKRSNFELTGWDVETGTPRRATLEEVGLGRVAEELAL